MSLKYVDNYGNEENIAGLGEPGSTVNAIGRTTGSTAIGDIVIDGNVTTFYAPDSPVKTYFNAWGTSIVFYVPAGHHALVMVSNACLYQVWNPNDQVQTLSIQGSGVTFTRDSSDKTKITASRSGSATWTVIVA